METPRPRQPMQHLTVRVPPSDLRRIEAAARAAGVTRSRVVRDGARQMAREILREASDGDGGSS